MSYPSSDFHGTFFYRELCADLHCKEPYFVHVILVLSFNQPKLCSTAAWDTNGITFANQTIIGSSPTAIFVNTNNTIYAVKENKEILVWITDRIDPIKIILHNFSTPFSIFVTNSGEIYIDNGYLNHQVNKWITNTFDTVMYVNSSCYGLFVDINNTLYCSIFYNHQVVKRWLNDSFIRSTMVAGTGKQGSASDQLSCPYGIFVDLSFNLYVADCYNHRIQLFQSGELNGTTIAGENSPHPTITLDCPTGIVLDADKYLFIVDTWNHRIVGPGPNGFRCLVGCDKSGAQPNQLHLPFSLSFDSYGNMFVTDLYNNRIQKFLFLENSCGKFKKINSLRTGLLLEKMKFFETLKQFIQSHHCKTHMPINISEYGTLENNLIHVARLCIHI